MDKTLIRSLLLTLFSITTMAQVGIIPVVDTPLPSSGSAVCGTYLHYRVITIPAQSTLSGNLSNYPVAVSGTYTYLATAVNGGLVQNASGFDVGFFTDNTCVTKLPWETETYGNTGVVNYWVQVPTISKTASVTFIMAYDNPAITTDQSNRTGVWDTNFRSVSHLPNGTTLSIADSTSYAQSWSNTGTVTAVSGMIDGGAAFTGANYINALTGSTLSPATTGKTYEAWVFATSFTSAYNSVISISERNVNPPFTLMVKSTGKLACYVGATGGVVNYDGTGTNTLSINTWYKVVLTYDSTAGLIGYVNGAVDGTAAANGTIASAGGVTELDIGAWPTVGGSLRFWNGTIDEARISSIARSADWVKTDYNSQNSPSTFYSIGSQF